MFLLTRPQYESRQMAQILETLGVPYFMEPLLSIELLDSPSLEGYKTLVTTSQNALRALRTIPKNLTVYCVGDSTGALAETLGAKTIIVAKNSVRELLQLLQNQDPQSLGPILYAAGEVVTENIEAVLKPLGYKIKTEVVYRAIPRETLSQELVAHFQNKAIQFVGFFSNRTADVFCALVKRHILEHIYEDLVALCLSQKIAQSIDSYPWKSLITAQDPSMNSFWQCVKNHVN